MLLLPTYVLYAVHQAHGRVTGLCGRVRVTELPDFGLLLPRHSL